MRVLAYGKRLYIRNKFKIYNQTFSSWYLSTVTHDNRDLHRVIINSFRKYIKLMVENCSCV